MSSWQEIFLFPACSEAETVENTTCGACRACRNHYHWVVVLDNAVVDSEDLYLPMIHVFSLWALVKILSCRRIYKAFDPSILPSEDTSPLDGLLRDGHSFGLKQVGSEGIHWLSKKVVFCTVSLSKPAYMKSSPVPATMWSSTSPPKIISSLSPP